MYICTFCGRGLEPLDAPTEVAGRTVCSPSCMERECARQTDGAHVGDGPTCGRCGRARKLVGPERGAAFAARAEAAGAPPVSMLACAEAPDDEWFILEAPEPGPYTRAQFAAAVDEAHTAVHCAEVFMRDAKHDFAAASIGRAHDALHRVGAGVPRVGCANGERDPEVQRLIEELGAALLRHDGHHLPPCGHSLADLIGGTGSVTKCGECLRLRQEARAAIDPPSPARTALRVRRSDPTSSIAAAVGEVVIPLLRGVQSGVIDLEIVARPVKDKGRAT